VKLLIAMNNARSAFDGGFGGEIPSGACSSIQKEKVSSRLRFRMATSSSRLGEDASHKRYRLGEQGGPRCHAKPANAIGARSAPGAPFSRS
jgi:hypothetical protein